MEYFWYNKGFTYDSSKKFFLSSYHLVLLILIIMLSFLLWKIVKKLPQPKQKLALKLVGIVLLVLELLRYINFLIIYNVTWFGAISFHLCSIGIYIGVIAAIFQKRWMFDLFLVHAIIGAPLALLVPDGILAWYNEYSFLPIQSFISHMLLIWIFIWAHYKKIWAPNLKRYTISIFSIIVSFLVAGFASRYNYNNHNGGHVNFIWTRFVDPSFPIVNKLDFPNYLIVMFLTLIIVGSIYPITFLVINNKRRKPQN